MAKRLLLASILFLGLLLVGCSESQNRIDARDIKSITVKNLQTEKTQEIDKEQFEEIAQGYNSSTRYISDVGTTLPLRAEMLLNDGSTIIIWGGAEDFLTIDINGLQFNIKSEKLGEWFEEFK